MKASQMPKRKPSVVVRLEPRDFADSWERRPAAGVAFGLRMLSDTAESAARRDAARHAVEMYLEVNDEDSRLEEYNNALMANAVGAAVCDPNDIDKWPDSLPVPQDSIRTALTPAAIRRLFGEYMLAQAALCPGAPEATNDEIEELLDRIPDLDDMAPWRASLVRRLLHRALEIAQG